MSFVVAVDDVDDDVSAYLITNEIMKRNQLMHN